MEIQIENKDKKDMENGKWPLHLCVLFSRIIVQKHVRIGCKLKKKHFMLLKSCVDIVQMMMRK